nr:acetyl-CoA C-acyltransferase [Saprospiraceae bacterium]
MKEVYILSYARTPLGSFGGQLSNFTAPQLGSIAIEAAVKRGGIKAEDVNEVFFGNVISANIGQAPAKQAALGAGLPNTIPCTTINKVCSSGMKSIIIGAQSIMTGENDIVLAGGMESMSNIPYYLDKARFGYKFGGGKVIDGLQRDGLSDAYDHQAMGTSSDLTASKLDISRKEQDRYAIQSYQRSAEATEKKYLAEEIVPVEIPQRKGDPVVMSEDEEFKRVKLEKVPNLRGAFSKDGTATAANSSTINDGAAAVILISGEKLKQLGLKPLAKIKSFADASQEPKWFTTTPPTAARNAMSKAGLNVGDIDYFEVNEAFALVALAFMKSLQLDESKVNVFGGAVSLGHPIGVSGTRITGTLANVLKLKGGKYGLAAICNGGGGASSIILESIKE